MNCHLSRRRSSDLALLWLWRKPAATAPIRPQAWEPPYAAGAALKRRRKTCVCVCVCVCVYMNMYMHTLGWYSQERRQVTGLGHGLHP